LQLRLHSFSSLRSLELNQSQCKEYLQFEFLSKLVVDHSDESTTNLDDLLLDDFWGSKVKQVLEAEGRRSSNVHGPMHDSFFDHGNQRCHARGQFKHLNALEFLLIEVCLNAVFIAVSVRDESKGLVFDVVSDCRYKQELRFFRQFVEERVHACDHLFDQLLIWAVHVFQDATEVNISLVVVDLCLLVGTVDGH